MATSAAAWAGPKTEEVTLPSGNEAVLRCSFPVYTLLRTGQFPDELFQAYGDYVSGDLQDPALASQLLDLIVSTMFVEPRVVAGDGKVPTKALHISKLDDADVEVVLQRALGAANEASSFRGDSPGADDSGDGEDVRDAS